METVTLSPRYQVVIPRAIRDSMGLVPGMPMQVMQYGDRIELIPARPMRSLRGLCRGLDTSFEREDGRQR
jgi:AbrB family looped-hinge helix DNA binding protein